MSKDFTLDDKGDIDIKNGDFTIINAEQQEIKFLLVSKKGEWKAHPLTGANIGKYLKRREGMTNAIREGKLQLKDDGFIVNKFKIEDKKINVEAER